MSQIAKVYAQALYDLAAGEGLTESILAQLKVLAPVLAKEEEFLRLLATSHLTKAERLQIVDDTFRGKVEPYLLNFLKLLTEKGYIRHFGDCCEAYTSLYNQQHGILPVKAVTAVPMTDAQQTKLVQAMEKITGKQIRLTNAIDASCMGGVRLDYDGKQVDDTIRSRLNSIHEMLKKTVL